MGSAPFSGGTHEIHPGDRPGNNANHRGRGGRERLLRGQELGPVTGAFPSPGWVEQDPFDIVRTVKEAVAPLIEKYRNCCRGV